jgi:hypothetical protein
MSYHYSSHEFGYVFVFTNSSPTLTLEEYVTFPNLTNLQLTQEDREEVGGDFWFIKVEPKSRVTKLLTVCKVGEMTKMNYKLDHKILLPSEDPTSLKEKAYPEKLSDKELIKILKQKGQAKIVKDNKRSGPTGVKFYYKWFESFYSFFFENFSYEYKFDAIFTFELENLKLDRSNDVLDDIWNISVEPMSKSKVRKIHVIDNKQGVGMKYSYTY